MTLRGRRALQITIKEMIRYSEEGHKMFKRKFILVTLIGLTLSLVIACNALSPIATQVFSQATVTPRTTTSSGATTIPNVVASPSVTTSSSPEVSAIQDVIQKTNQEQIQAVASQDPTVMQDTSTTDFYQQSVQTLNGLLNGGVTSIQLVDLKWGPITLTDANNAQATTYETWSTTFSDGSKMQETDTNIYILVLENGVWKVQDDQHPDPNNQQSASANPSGGPSPVTPVPPADIAPGQADSFNWAGYHATGGTFTAVSGTWTVPNVDAGTIGMDATWVGIGGVDSTDLIQAGTEATVENGQVIYSAMWETLPDVAQQVPLTINAGDQISVSITQQKTDTWQISINNVTNGQSWTKSATYSSSLSSAEWIEEAPATERSTILPLDNFGALTFTSGTTVENGQTATIAQTGARPINMNNGSGQALTQTSNLDASGTSFTVTRTDAAPTIPPFHHRRFGG